VAQYSSLVKVLASFYLFKNVFKLETGNKNVYVFVCQSVFTFGEKLIWEELASGRVDLANEKSGSTELLLLSIDSSNESLL